MQASQQAIALMGEWRDVSAGEALQMLSTAFRSNPAVREFGVKKLSETASDDTLLEFMIQLVQCVRFDGSDGRGPLAGALCPVPARPTALSCHARPCCKLWELQCCCAGACR